MSEKSIAQLFAEKVQGKESVLGAASGRGEVILDNEKNRHYKLFENGVIIEKCVNAKKPSHLSCTYGRLFHEWWGNPRAAWLGTPLEDLYETTNRDGVTVMVQRFENGVIWCPSDGSGDIIWLSWHDWHMISKPGDNKDTRP